MVYGPNDAITHRRFIEQSDADEVHKRIERAKLNALIGLCETTACRRQTLLHYFGDTIVEPCGNCDTCLNPDNTWDGTLSARKALYLIRLTEQRFGAQHLIDILVGRSTDRTVRFGHDTISAFGRGKELTEREWHSVFRQLVAYGYLTVDFERFGCLKLTEKSGAVLEKKTTVLLRKDPAKERKTSRSKASAASAPELTSDEDNLFEALKALRWQIAQENSVPPYVIFHDTTLRAIARSKPKSLAKLREIPGVGDRKLETYGEQVLQVIRSLI